MALRNNHILTELCIIWQKNE